ncbi:putative nucleotide-diphospho-sugar transferase [Catenovulum sediminis]|uniref:Nucleotide-diphospho-sugar transferase n=1 Tax=Catenovulum sediminis TaxID=1740262 RepID=A0ABV1RG12_9ALTE|nr:putative nucleotide-diphospho-sugar transferase [Catenovulum sediminis]
MIIVAFHTNDPLYNAHCELLKRSAEKLNLSVDVTCIEPSDWLTATAFKARFLLDMRKKHTGPILYVDADAFIHSNPKEILANYDADIGVHYLNNQELVSGTLLLNDTQSTHKLLENWVAAVAEFPCTWEQKVLQELINEKLKSGQLSVAHLPAEFTFIFDISREQQPLAVPIIEHLQAAREIRLKKKNNKWFRRLSGIKKKPNKRLLARRKKVEELAQSVDFVFPFERI